MSALRLILTRHAKSSWDEAGLSDHDRPLSGRGKRACVVLGDWMASRGLLPEQVLCSDARRTRETWARISPRLGEDAPAALLLSGLYLASAEEMMATMRRAEGPVVMQIGHNPGIAEFAARLLARPCPDPDFARYPTGATSVISFEADAWSDVEWGSGGLIEFIAPRRLEA